MAQYPFEELAMIHYIYGFCDGNGNAAVREYAERFPNRRLPTKNTFINTHRRFCDGTLFTKGDRPGNVQHGVEVDEAILNEVEENPSVSIRRVAAHVGVPRMKVQRVLKEDKQHPFHLTPVQELLPADFPVRFQFCQIMLQRNNRNGILNSILWTDEATFTRDGVTNYHNEHVWSIENPHAKRQRAFQRRFSVNVWAGVIGNELIGPRILPPRLNGQNYLNFLEEYLENVPLQQRRTMVFQHDGAPAPPHCA